MDENRFEEIVREQKDRVFGYALYMLGDREDAGDVAQEAFIALWEKGEEAIDIRRYASWLLTVAHNRCLDRLRGRRRQLRWAAESPGVGITIPGEGVMEKGGDAQSELERRETRRAVLQALQRLPGRTRSVILLHYYRGLKYREIAEMLGTTTGAIRVEVHRGRGRLRAILGKRFPERIGGTRNE